ncbi:MAG: sigma-70 family RNA polymerase sigma factor [Saprospiraceae bacterium]
MKGKHPCTNFAKEEDLFHALVSLRTDAIACLQSRVEASVVRFAQQYQLSAQDAEEILNDSTWIFLKKIGEGAYTYQGNALSTYLIEIAKRLILNRAARQRRDHHVKEKLLEKKDDYEVVLRQQNEYAALVQQFLSQLDEKCQKVITLFYIQGYPDEEVIQQQLTDFTTVDSLKVKRSACKKKLIEIAKKWKTSKPV